MEADDPTTKQAEELAKLRTMLDLIRASRPKKADGQSSAPTPFIVAFHFVVGFLAICACIACVKNRLALIHVADAVLVLANSVEKISHHQSTEGLREMSEFVDKLRFGEDSSKGCTGFDCALGCSFPGIDAVNRDPDKEL